MCVCVCVCVCVRACVWAFMVCALGVNIEQKRSKSTLHSTQKIPKHAEISASSSCLTRLVC